MTNASRFGTIKTADRNHDESYLGDPFHVERVAEEIVIYERTVHDRQRRPTTYYSVKRLKRIPVDVPGHPGATARALVDVLGDESYPFMWGFATRQEAEDVAAAYLEGVCDEHAHGPFMRQEDGRIDWRWDYDAA